MRWSRPRPKRPRRLNPPSRRAQMSDITTVYEWAPFGVPVLRFAYLTVLSTILVVAMLIAGAVYLRRRLALVPGPIQGLTELTFDWFDTLVADALELKDRRYFPLIMALFLFLLMCNWIGMLPIPYLREPTRDINTPAGMAVIGFVVAHSSAIKFRGIKS